jgi:hypothetical protein
MYAVDRRSHRGIAPVILVIIVMTTGLLLCAAHFGAARNLRLQGRAQAEFLQARYLAQAGLAKALVVLKREHQMGRYRWQFPGQFDERTVPSKEFCETIDGGSFQVVSVEPLVIDRPSGRIGPFVGKPYVVGRTRRGSYDVYRIRARGVSPGGRQVAGLQALVKMVRLLEAPTVGEPGSGGL